MTAKLEVIVQNAAEAEAAEAFGASRVELVSAIKEGGLTPSLGTIKQVTKRTTLPVSVMLRPHSYSFQYSKDDLAVIMEDLHVMKKSGVSGIVFGCLTAEGRLDHSVLQQVIHEAAPMEVTFHRAFDEMEDVEQGYRELAYYFPGVTRVLTSGGEQTAVCGKAMETLARLMSLQKNLEGPNIMPGAGITTATMEGLHQKIGAEEYHVGSGVRLESDYSKSIDTAEIKKILSILA